MACSQRRVIQWRDRAEQHLVTYRTAVDEIELVERIGAGIGRQSRQPADNDATARKSDLLGVLGKIRPDDLRQPGVNRILASLGGPVDRLPVGARQNEMHPAMRHGQALDHIGYRPGFGPVGFEELEPGRDIGKEVLDLHNRAAIDRMRHRAGFDTALE